MAHVDSLNEQNDSLAKYIPRRWPREYRGWDILHTAVLLLFLHGKIYIVEETDGPFQSQWSYE